MAIINATPNADQLLALIERECAMIGDPKLSFQFFATPTARKTYRYDHNKRTGYTETITSPVVTGKGPGQTLLVTLNTRLVQKMIAGAVAGGSATCSLLEQAATEFLRAECRLAPRHFECAREEPIAYAT